MPTPKRFVGLMLAVGLVVGSGLGSASSAAAGPSFEETVRFLEQATFGPTLELIARVQQVGLEAFIAEQFALPPLVVPQLDNWPTNPPSTCTGTCVRDNYSMYPLQVGTFAAFLGSPHQLRLCVLFALNQIFVVSAIDGDLRQPSRVLPYLQVLSDGAFGNFRRLLTDITLNPAMASYLDTVNNNRTAPNENYGRELLQLFTIGVNELQPDGTVTRDGDGQPSSSLTQTSKASGRAATPSGRFPRVGRTYRGRRPGIDERIPHHGIDGRTHALHARRQDQPGVVAPRSDGPEQSPRAST